MKINVKIQQAKVDNQTDAPMEIPDLKSAISTLQNLISEDNSVSETGGNVVTKRILDLVENQEDDDHQQVVTEDKPVREFSTFLSCDFD